MSKQDLIAAAQANIDKFGWHCLSVSPSQGQPGTRFTYTIGLEATFRHPELMIFGLDNRLSHGLLSDCVDRIRAGTAFAPDTPYPGILGGGYDVVFKPVRAADLPAYFALADRVYDGAPFRGLVLFWPDERRRFPWEETASTAQRDALAIVE